MKIKLYIIVFILVSRPEFLFSGIWRSSMIQKAIAAPRLNQSYLTCSFDFRPTDTRNSRVFKVHSGFGWSVNYMKPIIRINHRSFLGLDLNFYRKSEECTISKTNEGIFQELRLSFCLKSIAPGLGFSFHRSIRKSTRLFIGINWNHWMDDGYKWKYHYAFTDVCDTVNFKSIQYYELKKKIPFSCHIGLYKQYRKFVFRAAIYTSGQVVTFHQRYDVSYCGNTISEQQASSNKFPFYFSFGVGYVFKREPKYH